MHKIQYILVFVLLSIFVTGCGTSVSYGLFFEESHIVTEIDGKIDSAGRITFEKGEKVGLALLDVGKFKQGEDGLHFMGMDFLVTGPNNEVIIDDIDVLGERGHVPLTQGISPIIHAMFTTESSMESGNYRLKITVYDKIGGGSTSVTELIILK